MCLGLSNFPFEYRSHRNKLGFTLIELAMVIVLLGVLSATALPKFFDFSGFREQAFFDDTLNAIRYAQKLAVASGCKVRVSISANTYTLMLPADSSQCLDASPSFTLPVRHPGTGEGSYSGSEPGVTLTSSHAYFNFNALGHPSVAVVLTVAGHRTINVEWETGFAYEP